MNSHILWMETFRIDSNNHRIIWLIYQYTANTVFIVSLKWTNRLCSNYIMASVHTCAANQAPVNRHWRKVYFCSLLWMKLNKHHSNNIFINHPTSDFCAIPAHTHTCCKRWRIVKSSIMHTVPHYQRTKLSHASFLWKISVAIIFFTCVFFVNIQLWIMKPETACM